VYFPPWFALVLIAIASVPAPAGVQSSAAAPARVCLNVNDIQRSEAADDQTIVFYMRDGKIWRNRLRMRCPMLKASPYTEKLSGDLLCSNAQFIHVALTGDDCALGEFTRID